MVLRSIIIRMSSFKNPLLLDSRGTNDLASITFFRRAKALYETNYESDPISIIQTLILIGSYWDGPEDVTKIPLLDKSSCGISSRIWIST